MPRPTTFNEDLAGKIIGARRVGASLKVAASAAGVPYQTFFDWLKRGRECEDPTDQYARFAAEVDKAGAQIDVTLLARVVRATEGEDGDARLAFDLIRWRADGRLRRANAGLAEAKRTVEEQRAKGEHVDRVEMTTKDPLDEIRSRIARLAATAGAGGGARESDTE